MKHCLHSTMWCAWRSVQWPTAIWSNRVRPVTRGESKKDLPEYDYASGYSCSILCRVTGWYRSTGHLEFQNGPKVYILTVSICTIVFLFLFHWDRKPQTKRLWWLLRVMLLFLSYLFPALRIHSLHRLCRVIKSREVEVEVSSIETADSQRFPVFLSVASVLVFSPLISAITTLHLDNQSRYQEIARPARRAHPQVSIANRCRTIEIELRSSRVRSRVFEFELMWWRRRS